MAVAFMSWRRGAGGGTDGDRPVAAAQDCDRVTRTHTSTHNATHTHTAHSTDRHRDTHAHTRTHAERETQRDRDRETERQSEERNRNTLAEIDVDKRKSVATVNTTCGNGIN